MTSDITLKNIDGLELLRSLKARSVDLVFCSPPYNIGSGGPRQDGRRKDGAYDPKSYGGITGYDDNMPEAEYQKSQVKMLSAMARVLKAAGADCGTEPAR